MKSLKLTKKISLPLMVTILCLVPAALKFMHAPAQNAVRVFVTGLGFVALVSVCKRHWGVQVQPKLALYKA